ncbi:MAG: polysaccharide deacetylase family protein [Chloroflexota bacterium]|nr:polysaccharide deacetylase family protein [Chloroflexota bacterium]
MSSPASARMMGILDGLHQGRVDVLAALTYHRVDEPAARQHLDPGLISAQPADFAKQMRYLASRRRVLSLHDLMAVQESGRAIPPRSVMITFDDAYQDFAQHAWPVLRGLGLPVTLFVPTAYPGDPSRSFWWDRLYHALQVTDRSVVVGDESFGSLSLRTGGDRANAYALLKRRVKSLPHESAMDLVEQITSELSVPSAPGAVLDWPQLRRLADEGVTLASHSRTHPLLSRVSALQLREELEGSMADMEREVGEAPRAVAYPDGAHSVQVLAAARRAKLSIGFTVVRGVNDLHEVDWLRLRRINVGAHSSLPFIRAQLVTYSGRRAQDGGSRPPVPRPPSSGDDPQQG